jgi:hypothetical protein
VLISYGMIFRTSGSGSNSCHHQALRLLRVTLITYVIQTPPNGNAGKKPNTNIDCAQSTDNLFGFKIQHGLILFTQSPVVLRIQVSCSYIPRFVGTQGHQSESNSVIHRTGESASEVGSWGASNQPHQPCEVFEGTCSTM